MFCRNYGQELADNAVFCGNCGTAQKQQAPAQQPVDQAPVQQPVYQALVRPAASEGSQNALLGTIAFAVAVLLLAASVILPLTTSFFDIPAVSVILSTIDADPNELTSSLEEAKEEAEEAQERFELQEEFIDDDEIEAAEALIDGMEKLLNNFSILNFNALVKTTTQVGEEYMDDSDLEEMQSVSKIMSVVIGVIIGAFALPLLFTLLGGFKKSVGLTVAAMILTLLPQLIFSGFIMVILSLAANILQIIVYKKQKAAC